MEEFIRNTMIPLRQQHEIILVQINPLQDTKVIKKDEQEKEYEVIEPHRSINFQFCSYSELRDNEDYKFVQEVNKMRHSIDQDEYCIVIYYDNIEYKKSTSLLKLSNGNAKTES